MTNSIKKLASSTTAFAMVLSMVKSAYAQAATLPTRGGAYGFSSIDSAIRSVVNLVFFFALVLVLIYLLWGGIQWITAGGDKSGLDSARGKITGAVVGIIIVSVAFAVYQLMLTFIGSTGNVFVLRET